MKKSWLFTILIITLTLVLNSIIFLVVYFINPNDSITANIFTSIKIFLLLIAFFVTINIILSKIYSYNKLIWLAIMIINPIAGTVFYFIFARNIKNQVIASNRPLISGGEYLKYEPLQDQTLEDEVFKYLHRNTKKSVFTDNTKTTILTNGDQFFPKLIETLKNAEHSIYMSFYIIQNDELVHEILNILKEKAEMGLEVKLLYDAFGGKLKRKYLNELKKAGVKIAVFEPLRLYDFSFVILGNLNFRYHRKITIVDGKYGFTGGMNLGKEYNHQSKKFGFWRDTSIMIEGMGVISLTNIFAKDWYYTTGDWPTPTYYYEKQETKGLVTSIESGADHQDAIIKEAYFKMINDAKKSIYITTPYLMVEPDIELALITAAKSGIDVKIMLPGKPDKFMINQATKSYYDKLLENNIKIYEYENTFVHAKVLIVDEKIASIGTVNFDPRSFNINFEATVFLQNDSVGHLLNDFNNDISHAVEIDKQSWKKRPFIFRLIQGLIGLFSPLF